MSKFDPNKLLIKLSQTFHIKKPNLAYKRNEGSWDLDNYTIWYDPRHQFGAKGTIVHEFAHCLCDNRYKTHHHHGRKFYGCLVEVINKSYSHHKYYPWRNEYPNLRRWAYNDGYWKSFDKYEPD